MSGFLRRARGPAAVVILVLHVLPPAFAETIHLNGGGVIRAPIIARKADRIFVDLDFTVLSIPADSIDRIAPDAEKQENGEARLRDLWLEQRGRSELTVKQNVQRCGEAVVQVRTNTGLGSGFVISPDGYVVTNDHVIAGEHKISLTLFQLDEKQELKKTQFNKVRIIATNPAEDLALLKIEDEPGRKFVAMPLGDSDLLRQGQRVFAIGSPLGLERSVSEGIVSLKNRAMEGRVFIQTTTQINPGNSGGPLFNLHGEVVGVTNMKIVATGAEGLGFAIPVATLKQFLSNREAFAFDPRNPNAGFQYNTPPDPDVPPVATPARAD